MVVTSGAARGGRGKRSAGDSGWRWCSRRLLVGHIVYGTNKERLMQYNRFASLIAATTNIFLLGGRGGSALAAGRSLFPGRDPRTRCSRAPGPCIMSSSEKDRGLSGGKEDESEDESEVLEESPCGRWQKRKEQVLLGGGRDC
ncbi:hypothetical protein NDU88_004256 [Pleurodeles waltl]|uniref:Uncharacterized protein n=1 Tax=Pleurodeles waltl TaxID=8319 RepID=A0AAV7V4S3_PLEWA|nr:hypothetical protein NDU88_004256 [Pleurodeles waltl]